MTKTLLTLKMNVMQGLTNNSGSVKFSKAFPLHTWQEETRAFLNDFNQNLE